MYSFLIKLWKIFSYTFRFFQIFGILYFLSYVVFWFIALAQLPIAGMLAKFYNIPYNMTVWILKLFGFSFSSDYAILKLDILTSVFFTFFALILYNFLFIPLDEIERFFVEKAFNKGEKSTIEL